MSLEQCSIHEATHIKTRGTIKRTYRILSKFGVGPGRILAPPSKGGFGVETEIGKLSMWQVDSYWREVKDGKERS